MVLWTYGMGTTKRDYIRCMFTEHLTVLIYLWKAYSLLQLCSFQYSKYPSSVAALSFSRDGRLLAVASSYTYEEGDKP